MKTLRNEKQLRITLIFTLSIIVVLAAFLVVTFTASPYPSIFQPSGAIETRGSAMMGSSMMGGMMGRGMNSMMGSMPMMRGMMGYYDQVTNPVTHEDSVAIAEGYLASLNNTDLMIDELEEYSHNFYVSIIEKSTGRGAIEIIIDRYSGALQPEPQSMMWNAKYHMMGYSNYSASRVEMSLTPDQAVKIAQDFLDITYPETRASEILAYYGYYTIMTTFNGEHYGMLSVNGYTGEIWYHTWHGMFISEVELE